MKHHVQDVSTNGTYLNGKRLPRPPFKNPAGLSPLACSTGCLLFADVTCGFGHFFTHLSESFDLCRTPECDFSMGMNCSSSAGLEFQVDFIGFCCLIGHFRLRTDDAEELGYARTLRAFGWDCTVVSEVSKPRFDLYGCHLMYSLQYAYCGSFSTPRLSLSVLLIIVYMNVVHNAYYA